jgi:hypothetical protein
MRIPAPNFSVELFAYYFLETATIKMNSKKPGNDSTPCTPIPSLTLFGKYAKNAVSKPKNAVSTRAFCSYL